MIRLLSLGAGVQPTTLALMACEGILGPLDGAISGTRTGAGRIACWLEGVYGSRASRNHLGDRAKEAYYPIRRGGTESAY